MQNLFPTLLLSGFFILFFKNRFNSKPNYKLPESIDGCLQKFREISVISNISQQQKQLNYFWNQLKKAKKIPFIVDESVLFLYRGDADSISFVGDFSGWGRNRKYNTKAVKINHTDVWFTVQKFPSDARLDYKVVVDKLNWVLDPDNPHQQWGGSGPNSEVQMPFWKPNEASFYNKKSKKGFLSDNSKIYSPSLQYDVQYRVYTPVNYNKLKNLPVIYVTDGHEYADEKLGAMKNVLDNLIHQNIIKPIIAVFIDPRNPDHLNTNRRMTEFAMNSEYGDFITKTLIPEVDLQYKTVPNADNRAILGTSLGGLLSAYVGINYSDSFHLVAINSPAFWYREKIMDLYETSEKLPLKIYMSTGVIMDAEKHARWMKEILEKKGYELKYKELNEGHSWGNWRQVLNEMLIYFFGK